MCRASKFILILRPHLRKHRNRKTHPKYHPLQTAIPVNATQVPSPSPAAIRPKQIHVSAPLHTRWNLKLTTSQIATESKASAPRCMGNDSDQRKYCVTLSAPIAASALQTKTLWCAERKQKQMESQSQ